MATIVKTPERGFVAGSPEEWAMYLPVLQAFIEGKKVQCRSVASFGRAPGEWRDTSTMYQVRMCDWRVKPDDIVEGTWHIYYSIVPTESSRITIKGVMVQDGEKDTEPFWPTDKSYVYDMPSQRFEPAPKKST